MVRISVADKDNHKANPLQAKAPTTKKSMPALCKHGLSRQNLDTDYGVTVLSFVPLMAMRHFAFFDGLPFTVAALVTAL